MEDGNGIELSLGLPCGGSVGKVGSKEGNFSNIKTEEKDDSVDNLIDDVTQKQDSDNGSKRNDARDYGKQVQEENFFTNLGKSSFVSEAPKNLNKSQDPQFIKYEGLWVANDKSKADEEVKSDNHENGKKLWPETNNKRKMSGEDLSCQKKHEREVQQGETHANTQRLPHVSSEASNDERKASSGKQQVIVIEEGSTSSSSQTQNEIKDNSSNFRSKEQESSHQQVVEGFPPEGSAIRPGIAPGMRFGGNGCCPNLPWVCTTGPGPNGKTISGVAYRYDKNRIRIVCACHGSHMSPEEFVQHAVADQPNPTHHRSSVIIE